MSLTRTHHEELPGARQAALRRRAEEGERAEHARRDHEGRRHRLARVGEQDHRQGDAIQRRIEGEEAGRRARGHAVRTSGQIEDQP